jgi:hypothetical protein
MITLRSAGPQARFTAAMSSRSRPLSSKTGDRANRDREALGLPTVPSVRDELDALSERLGVP